MPKKKLDLCEATARKYLIGDPPRGCVAISRMEWMELGIPQRSLRGTALFVDYCLVNRRCLKRYRRRHREAPVYLYGFAGE